VLVVVSLALRLAASLTVGAVPELHGDEAYYVFNARDILHGRPATETFRPPGFAIFLAAVMRIAGESLRTLRVAQACVGTLLVVFVYGIVRRGFGERPAFISALVCSLHPTLIQYTHFLWSELLFATLLLGGVWALDRWSGRHEPQWLLAAGVLLALAGATREIALALFPLAGVWVYALSDGPTGRRLKNLLGLTVAAMLVVAAWGMRNHSIHGRWAPLATNGWYAMALGNLLPANRILGHDRSHAAFQAGFQARQTELERMEFARTTAIRAIVAEQPGWILRKTLRNSFLLFAPRSQLGRFVDHGWVPSAWTPVARRLVQAETLYYAIATTLGITALWLVPGGSTKALVLGVLGLHIVVHIVANATYRFRVPLLPCFAIYVGPLLANWRALSRAASSWRIAGAVISLLLFGFVIGRGQLRALGMG
jgi:4-amino-4-deoxy-L-arabinose transferase-like glycosyltransferase